MGQRAVGILYGCELPELPNNDDGEAPYDLISRWDKFAKINASLGRESPRIRFEREGEKDLIGVWVAVGGSGEDNTPYFLDECCRLDQVEKVFTKQIKACEKLWNKFAKYAAKHESLALDPPALWLTPCEVA